MSSERDRLTSSYVTLPTGERFWFEVLGSAADTAIIPAGFLLRDSLSTLATAHTLILYDPRGRGRSTPGRDSTDVSIARWVADLEALRSRLHIGHASLVGFSIYSLVVANYAAQYPEHTNRVILIGAAGVSASDSAAPEPPDRFLRSDTGKLRELARMDSTGEARTRGAEYCRLFYGANLGFYVADPADAPRVSLDFCDLPNENPGSVPDGMRWLQQSSPTMTIPKQPSPSVPRHS